MHSFWRKYKNDQLYYWYQLLYISETHLNRCDSEGFVLNDIYPGNVLLKTTDCLSDYLRLNINTSRFFFLIDHG